MGKIIEGLFPSKKKKEKTVCAIIAAAGSGTRMGLDFNKLFLSIEEKPVIAYTIDSFEECDAVDDIIIVCSESDFSLVSDICSDFNYQKVSQIVTGGKTRQESIYKGLLATSGSEEIVLVHDGARPLVSEALIEAVINKARDKGAAAPAVPVKDTVKKVNSDLTVRSTVDRESLFCVQTPQGFGRNVILSAHEKAYKENIEATDDCALAEKLGQKVYIVPGESSNVKLTTPDDYFLISALIAYRGDYE